MTPSRTLVVTGASGRLGTYLRSSLGDLAKRARLVDIVAPPCAWPGEPVEILQGSVTDPDLLDRVCRGADALVHLGGFAGDAPWQDLSEVNVGGTYQVLEAARRHGLAAGRGREQQPRGRLSCPGTRAARRRRRAAARQPLRRQQSRGGSPLPVLSVKFAMNIVCLRIGSCFDTPENQRMLSTWLSPADFVRLVGAALTTPAGGLPARLGRVGEHAPLVVDCGRRGHRLSSGGQRRELRRSVPRKLPRARVRRGSHDLGTDPRLLGKCSATRQGQLANPFLQGAP